MFGSNRFTLRGIELQRRCLCSIKSEDRVCLLFVLLAKFLFVFPPSRFFRKKLLINCFQLGACAEARAEACRGGECEARREGAPDEGATRAVTVCRRSSSSFANAELAERRLRCVASAGRCRRSLRQTPSRGGTDDDDDVLNSSRVELYCTTINNASRFCFRHL